MTSSRPVRLLLPFAVAISVLVVVAPTPPPAAAATLLIDVTTTDDVVDAGDGVTSLREAFAQASGDGMPTEIRLQAGATYDLTACTGGGSEPLYHDEEQALTVVGNDAGIHQTCSGWSVLNDAGPFTTLRDLTVTGGSQACCGSAVYIEQGDIDGLVVDGNTISGGMTIVGDTGPSTVDGSTFRNNSSQILGGAITTFGPLTVQDSVFTGNSSADGGAITAGELTVRRSTFRDNHAGSPGGGGGAITAVGPVTLVASTVVDNTAGYGGGVYSNNSLTAINSTVVGNTATGQGGGLRTNASLVVDHSTVADNDGADGANLMSLTGMEVTSSVIWDPTPSSAPSCGAFGGFVSHGHNLFEPACGTPVGSDLTGDPVLGPLRDNGGPTPTMFPLAGSPLADTVPPGDCTRAIDQRSVARPFGGGCDTGAVEQVYPAHGLSDVPPWVEDAVRWITSDVNDPAIMEGFADDTFRPNEPITRAQVVRLLYREAGSPAVDVYPAHGFSDVPPWVEDAVRWAAGEDIATGYDDGTFRPNEPITRAAVVRMKYRLAGSPAVAGLPAHGFSDVPGWVQDAVTWAADTGNPLPLITGYADATFRPGLDISRAQVARMDYRLAITPDAWQDPGAAPPTLPFVAPT